MLLPSILLSGFMFPFAGMPRPAQVIAEALPMTHFMRLIRGVMLRGASLEELAGELLVLAGFIVVLMTLAILRFQQTSGLAPDIVQRRPGEPRWRLPREVDTGVNHLLQQFRNTREPSLAMALARLNARNGLERLRTAALMTLPGVSCSISPSGKCACRL